MLVRSPIICDRNDLHIISATLAVDTVLEWSHYSLGENVVLRRIAHIEYHITSLPKNKSFSIPVIQHHIVFLLRYQQELGSQLNDLHATLCIDEEKREVQVIPCQRNEGIEDWQSRCQEIVDRFIKRFKDEKFVVPLKKKALMRPVIDGMIQSRLLVHMDYMEDRLTVYITGEATEVNKVKKKLEGICESLSNEEFNIPVGKKDLMHPVIDETIQNEQLVHIEYMKDKSIVFITGEQSEITRVKKQLEYICESLIIESFNVPLDKKDLMDPFIEAIQNKQLLRVEYEKEMSIVFITGELSEVVRVKTELEDICEMIVVKENFPITSKMFYILLDAVLFKDLLVEHPNVKASIDADSYSITMTGFRNYCEQFKEDLLELNSTLQCVPVLLHNPFDQFIITQTGRKLLDYYAGKFISQSITYYIDDQTNKLFVLGSSKRAAVDALTRKIENNLHCISIPVAFQKSLLGSAWVNFSIRLEKAQLVQISCAKNKIEVIGDSRMCELVRKAIVNFIQHHDVAVRKFPLHRGQWRLIKLHLNKEWCKIERKFQKDSRVQLKVPDICDENPSITIEADVEVFKTVEKEIERFLSVIVSSSLPITEKRPGIISYFYSEAGKCAVHQIETDEQSYVHISQFEDNNTNTPALVSKDGVDIHDTSSGLNCNKMCTGFTRNVTINLYHGDVTALHVDVMVNATNLQLQHTSSVAEAIAKAGGPCIQRDSDAYLKSFSNLKEGDVIITQEVGNLPCKRLIHVVSPKWIDGTHKESFLLKKACARALQMASGFQSISFPAIGCGSYEFPTIVCAKTMVEAVITYSQENPSSSITEVSFVVLDPDDVYLFGKIMNELLFLSVTFTSTKLTVASTSPSKSSKHYCNDKESHSQHSKFNVMSSSHSLGSNTVDSYYMIGAVVVEFVQGDITDDDSDAIVNPTNGDMCLSSAGQVSTAILNKGGSELQIICNSIISQGYYLKRGLVCSTDSTDSLMCKKIFHINMYSQNLTDVIFACLQQAELSQLTSIAFPAIGTGGLGYDVDVAAQFICQPVIQFAQSLPNYVKNIRFVIFQRDMVYCFKRVFQKLRVAKLSGVVLPSTLQSSSSSSSILYNSKPSVAPSPTHLAESISAVTKNPIIYLQVFADSIKKVKHTENRLQQLIDKNIMTVLPNIQEAIWYELKGDS